MIAVQTRGDVESVGMNETYIYKKEEEVKTMRKETKENVDKEEKDQEEQRENQRKEEEEEKVEVDEASLIMKSSHKIK